jgi:glyoxylase-like metal-dependent hydrolase (beta-lactamase superfamily II)
MKHWSTVGGYKIIQVLSGRSNVFLLTNEITNILIDTGPGFMWYTLQKRLEKLGIDKIDLLILTHSHFDHAANASGIKEKYRAQVIIHSSEDRYLAAGDNVLPTGTNAFARFIVKALAKQFRSFARYQPASPTIHLTTLTISQFWIQCLSDTYARHTQGSISLIVDDEVPWWEIPCSEYSGGPYFLLLHLIRVSCLIAGRNYSEQNARFLFLHMDLQITDILWRKI